MGLFGRRRVVLDHPYLGRLRYVQHYWEGEIAVPGLPEKVGLTLTAPESGPSEAQVAFCRQALADLDALFERCRPVFAGSFEEWTGMPFPASWRGHFALVGLDVPIDGDATRPWEACYFVDAANHYFTAHFENGRASFLTIDG